MTLRISHCGDVHLEEDRYFGDTARCLEWFVCDGIRQNTNLFVINGDLTTYKATIKERNIWIDMVIRMAEHAPVRTRPVNPFRSFPRESHGLYSVTSK